MIPDKAGRTRSAQHRVRSSGPPNVPVADTHPVPCPVAAIGIPNGPLDPLAKLLQRVPAHIGMAFIVVPSPPGAGRDFLKALQPLTPLRVMEAADGVELRPGTLYVAPRDAFLKVSGGILRQTPRQPDDASPALDPFFCSLASELGHRAIGILLTDAPSDGILGLRAIQRAAGITFAQGSLVSADATLGDLATGCADYRLAPEEVGLELVRLAAHPYVLRSPAETLISEVELDEIHRALIRMASADLRSFRPELVRRRVLRRMALRQIVSAPEYIRYFRENPDEAHNLCAELLLQGGGFFQEPATFEGLRAGLYDGLWKEREDTFRAWVPYCSTGEETYSTAIAVLEMLEQAGPRGAIQVFGTAVDERSLEIARRGAYPAWALGNLAEPRLSRFFDREGHDYRIRREVRELCVFARQHLVSDPPLSRMDLVVYRNRIQCLIPAMQARVLGMLHYSLREGGVLALGASDSTEAAPNLFTAVPGKRGIYVRKENGVRRWSRAPVALPDAGSRTSNQEAPVPAESTPPPVVQHAAAAAPEPLPASAVDLRAMRASQHVQSLLEEQTHTIEALRVANEEISLSNEELMVTNEELTAAREELHAANQELGTLNQELEDRNRALARTASDLSALLRNINIPVVVVDSKLRIRHFTPQAQKLFSFVPQDLGRPITDLKPKLEIPELELLLNETLANLASHAQVVRSSDNERYWVSIRPYRREDQLIDGAILCAWPLV